MNQSQNLALRFKEVMLNGTWIANTNFKQQLEDTDYKLVTTSIHSLNSIALLIQHIHYYIHGILPVFNGGTLDIKDKYSFDFPIITSQQQWESILTQLWQSCETFTNHIEQLSEEQLQQAFVDEKYGTYYRNIDAMIEHCYYHLGQIVLIKKMLSITK